MKDTLLPVRSRSTGRWGYFSTARRALAIPAEFSHAEPFSDGNAWVSNEGTRGVIDTRGNFSPVQRFDEVGPFGSGLAPFNIDSRMEYAPYENRHYRTGGTWGFVDSNGKVAIPATHLHVTAFSEGLGFVHYDQDGHAFQPERHSRCIDPSGKALFEGRFQTMYRFREGRIVVCQSLEKWGWLDRSGKEICERRYDLAWSFSEGLAAALINKGYRHVFVDPSGREKFTAPEGLNYVGAFGDGLCWGQTGEPRDIGGGQWFPGGSGKVGFFDTTGKWAIKPAFESARDFHCERAVVTGNGRFGYIDRKGRFAIDGPFETASDFSDGFAVVENDGKQRVIDTSGRTVWAG